MGQGISQNQKNQAKIGALPIVYSAGYGISYMGLEKLHPFDSINYLIEKKLFTAEELCSPRTITDEELKAIHTKEYLVFLFSIRQASLKSSKTVSKIVEIPIVASLPASVVESNLATFGSLMAGDLALKYGWGINLGGGFHHSSADQGSGFCVYADISLMVNRLSKVHNKKKIMIIDLDAHRGNGHELDKKKNNFNQKHEVFIFDFYSGRNFPWNNDAVDQINSGVAFPHYSKDDKYLSHLMKKLPIAFDKFKPDFVIFNAGTDCLVVSEAGIIRRDEYVFFLCQKRKVPITYLLSGGYQKNNFEVISKSLMNLKKLAIYSLARGGETLWRDIIPKEKELDIPEFRPVEQKKDEQVNVEADKEKKVDKVMKSAAPKNEHFEPVPSESDLPVGDSEEDAPL